MIKLCQTHEIEEGSSKGFSIAGKSVFVVKKNGQFYGYVNSCPHIGIELDWMPDQFLDISRQLIQCSTHGAQFNIESGLCISGPCQGERLKPVRLTEKNQLIYLLEAVGPD